MEQLFVEGLAAVAGPHRQKDVSTDELVDDLTVSSQTLEHQLVVLEGHVELFELPVD